MEDDLNIYENGRRPQLFRKCKMALIFWKMENDINLLEDAQQHQCFGNGRQP